MAPRLALPPGRHAVQQLRDVLDDPGGTREHEVGEHENKDERRPKIPQHIEPALNGPYQWTHASSPNRGVRRSFGQLAQPKESGRMQLHHFRPNP